MNSIVIGERNFEQFFQKSVKKLYFRDTSVAEYPDATIVNEHRKGFGVFDENGRFVPESLQVRRNAGQIVPKFDTRVDVPYIDENVVFIGNVYPHFGHFLLEHMNRLYALLDKKYQGAKVVLINDKNVNPVPKYMFNLLELFGVDKQDVIILDKTTKFKNVCVPVQSFNSKVYSSYAYGATFDRIAERVPDTEIYEKIYMSRTALDAQHKVLGEEKVQSIFEKNGFKIICPETLPLSQQISLVKNCKVLAGCAGTALHLALFMKPGGTVIQIKRNRLPKDNAGVQFNINKTKGLNGVFISGSIETRKTQHGSAAPQIIGVNKYMREFFDKYKFKYSAADIQPDVSAIQEYNKRVQEYNAIHGGVWINKCKHFFIKFSALFVPGRERRGKYRHWMAAKLNYQK